MKKIDFFYNALFVAPVRFLLPVINMFLPKMRERESHIKFNNIPIIKKNNQKRLWFHASSMGEFEQAKPIIELIKRKYPDIYIICTFYSPSGYNNQKNYQYADSICYMPFDTLKNAKDFVELINPDLAVFVRYDIWLNHLNALIKKNIPVYLICATAPSNKTYLKVFKGYLSYIYGKFNYIFTMTPDAVEYFQSLELRSTIVPSSDSRFDRIIATVNEYIDKPLIAKEVFEDYKVLVVGSSWEPDEKIVSTAVDIYNQNHLKKIKIIYVPHEPTQKHIEKLLVLEPKLVKYSEIEKIESSAEIKELIKDSHLVVDSIGKLLKLYSNGDIVYIGGAFGAGIHSVTEPAGYGVPVICGKDFDNSPDAVNMVRLGLLKPIGNMNEMLTFLEYLYENPEKEKSLACKTKDYIFGQGGASEIISTQILKTVFPDSL
ncbi:MAG: glycosyltransferase N-terminal domain-containing protein [bacterium]